MMPVRVVPAEAARLGEDPGDCADADIGAAIIRAKQAMRMPADSPFFKSVSFQPLEGNRAGYEGLLGAFAFSPP